MEDTIHTLPLLERDERFMASLRETALLIQVSLQIEADGWRVEAYSVSYPNCASSYQSSGRSVNPLY